MSDLPKKPVVIFTTDSKASHEHISSVIRYANLRKNARVKNILFKPHSGSFGEAEFDYIKGQIRKIIEREPEKPDMVILAWEGPAGSLVSNWADGLPQTFFQDFLAHGVDYEYSVENLREIPRFADYWRLRR